MKGVILFLVTAVIGMSYAAMTMKQIRQTGKTLRKSCVPKAGVEEDKISGLSEGTFIEEKEVMCYIACVLKMMNTIKNGKINYEAAMKQADMMLLDEMREPTKAAMTKCQKVPEDYKDLCEGAFHTAKCMYNAGPDTFFFP